MTPSEIIEIIIGSLSLIATIAISFMIYWLQKRHERINEQKETEHLAKIFLLENAEEIDFLPSCAICASLNVHAKQVRKIYGEYLKCDPKVQREILRQGGCSFAPIAEGGGWVEKAIESLRDDIKNYGFGEDFLYDEGKYLTRALDYREERFDPKQQPKYEDYFEYRHIDKENGLLTFNQYFDDYFYYKFRDDGKKKLPEEAQKPIDYLIIEEHLRTVDEDKVCYWMMTVAEEVMANVRLFKKDLPSPEIGDAQPTTYEDKYYEALHWLYFTYIKRD